MPWYLSVRKPYAGLNGRARHGRGLVLALTGMGSLVLRFWAVLDRHAGSNTFGAHPNGNAPAA